MKHVYDIVSDNRTINNDIWFTEKEINLSDFTSKIMKTWIFVIESKFSSVVYRCRDDVAVLGKFDANRISIFIVEEHAFPDSIHSNVSLKKIALMDATIFSVNAIFTNRKFYGNYNRGIQLWSLKSVQK